MLPAKPSGIPTWKEVCYIYQKGDITVSEVKNPYIIKSKGDYIKGSEKYLCNISKIFRKAKNEKLD